MALLITTIEKMKARLTPEGFLAFCKDQEIDPNNYVEPEDGVMADGTDLERYYAQAGQELRASLNALKDTVFANPPADLGPVRLSFSGPELQQHPDDPSKAEGWSRVAFGRRTQS